MTRRAAARKQDRAVSESSTDTWRRWPRLQSLLPQPKRLEDDIRRTVEAIPHDGLRNAETDRQWCAEAACHLRRLLNCPAALKALEEVDPKPPSDPTAIQLLAAYRRAMTASPSRGRPRTQDVLAYAYAVRKALLGPRKANTAKRTVARLWKVKIAKVRDAYTEHREFVDDELSWILRHFARSRHEWVLELMWDQLLDERKGQCP